MKVFRVLVPAALVAIAIPAGAEAHMLDPQAGMLADTMANTVANTLAGSLGSTMAGVLHPFTGADHLLTLLMAGFWARRLGGTARAVIPLALLAGLLGGALAAMNHLSWAGVEALVWGSAGLMCWLAVRGTALGWKAGLLLAGIVGLAHGYAHVSDGPVSQAMVGFVGGLLVGSAVIMLGGALLARAIGKGVQQIPCA